MVIMVNASLVATSAAASKQQQCSRSLVIVTLDVEAVYSAEVSAALNVSDFVRVITNFVTSIATVLVLVHTLMISRGVTLGSIRYNYNFTVIPLLLHRQCSECKYRAQTVLSFPLISVRLVASKHCILIVTLLLFFMFLCFIGRAALLSAAFAMTMSDSVE